ncbi:MAG: hypothetical protein Q9M46_04720 [Ghiorsea sp.]|nr:hypothetical protein [Ghiorsea sp.]
MMHLPNNQRGVVGMALGLPFVAVVTDDGGNVEYILTPMFLTPMFPVSS